jgi:SAM-dependent methyltransferase
VNRQAIKRALPGPAKRLGALALGLVDPLVVATVRRRRGWEGPIPPRELRARVGDGGVEFFVDGGERVAGEVASVLADAGRPLQGFDAIWEFGCGSGRVLCRLPASSEARLAGSDVDEAAIAWLHGNYPAIDARVNSALTPAPFEDDSFDLIYVISVFTHISELSQDAWLGEIARVLRPGGTALITVMEQDPFERYRAGWRPGATEEQIAEMRSMDLSERGIVFVPERVTRWNRWRFAGVESTYGLTFHDGDYVRERWSRWFDVLDIASGAVNFGQSAVVCAAK